MRTLLAVIIAAILALVATLLSAEALALTGLPRNEMVNTALCCLWLIIIFAALRQRQQREH